MIKLKRCTICKVERPYTRQYFYQCSKVKSGLAAKCKTCTNKQSKIYMRRTRLAVRLKKLGLYNGRLSFLEIEKLSAYDLASLVMELSKQLLYSGQRSRFCSVCEIYNQNNHKHTKI